MHFKYSVITGAMPSVMTDAMKTVDVIHKTLFKYDCVITSIRDGKRDGDSLHPYGFAFDVRTRHLSPMNARRFHLIVSRILGRYFDVVLTEKGHKSKPPHLHVEFDPRELAALPFEEWEKQG